MTTRMQTIRPASAQRYVSPMARGSPDGADVLWTDFVPDELKKTVTSFTDREASVAAALADRVDAMWAEVDAIAARNRERRALLREGGAFDHGLSAMADLPFWDTKERIALRFALPLADLNVEGGEEPAPDPAAEAADDPAAGGAAKPSAARALRMTSEQLLDPAYHQKSLRRYFTPILQRRGELPKTMSLLLDAVQQIQSGELATLEDDLQNDATARVPLYAPFRTIATFIQQHLTGPSSLAAVEAGVVQQHRALDQRERADAEHVADDAALVEAGQLNEEEQTRAAQHMWVRLFESAAAREHRYADDARQYKGMMSTGLSAVAALREALDRCAADSAASLQSLMRTSATCSDTTESTAERAAAIAREAELMFHRNAQQLQEAIRGKLYRLEKSEAQQERLARRVREAVKELYAEQVRYAEVAQEAMLAKIALRQLECSYSQLRDTVRVRQAAALSTDQRATDVQSLVRDADACRRSLLLACAQHVERVERDQHFQRCHVVDYIANNVQMWERKVRDIEFLYDERYCALVKKTAMSWQLEYLAVGEREKAVDNLTDVREELQKVVACWQEVCRMRDALDLDPQTLGSEGKTANELRRQMRLLDDNRAVQRRVVTWKAFKKAPATPVRGGGRGAVARLAEQRRFSATAEPRMQLHKPLPAILPVE
ncbi:hypothetical protein STCU_06062 [Strigomonas culicis]|uniref:Uncharacterized protein n=1 Tax=Strigomonas culicis TaxID=28005 RepID=S9VIA3_9TRYP|nr:hypothetical protein STCU_06062 [Strigomonas culicis]|eukprot:EPY26821.1 hypothetical protein STCU_06062 [Strigomonas culicis]